MPLVYMNVQLILIVAIFVVLVLLTLVSRERMEVPDMYPTNKFLVLDTIVKNKDECIQNCEENIRCNAVQYYHPIHPTQPNSCRMIRIEDPDKPEMIKSGSLPMTTIIVKK